MPVEWSEQALVDIGHMINALLVCFSVYQSQGRERGTVWAQIHSCTFFSPKLSQLQLQLLIWGPLIEFSAL